MNSDQQCLTPEFLASLINLFSNPNNEVRQNAEQTYFLLETQYPNQVILILFHLIESQISDLIVHHCFIRIKQLVFNYFNNKIDIKIDEVIKFLMKYLARKDGDGIFDNYVSSILTNIYFKIINNKMQMNDMITFFIEIYKIKPVISLGGLTEIFNIAPSSELAEFISNNVNFNIGNDLYVQSILSYLCLIKNGINPQDFIMNLHNILQNVPDDKLKEPINNFVFVFNKYHNPFLPNLSNIVLFFLKTLEDPQHDEMTRILCISSFTSLVEESNECRRIMLNEPSFTMKAFADALSDPINFPDLYIETKKSLKAILNASLDDVNVFDPYIKNFGLNDNLYISSVFLYHIDSPEIFINVFNNIFSNDPFIRQNMFRILKKILIRNEQYLNDEISSKIIEVIVQYLKIGNYSDIFNIFDIISQKKSDFSQNLQYCISPVVQLLHSGHHDLKLLIIASTLYKLFPDIDEMKDTAFNLLIFSKKLMYNLDDNDDDNFIQLFNIFFNSTIYMNPENIIIQLQDVMPLALKSINRLSSNPMLQFIELLSDSFIVFIPDILNVIFKITYKEINFEVVSQNETNQEDNSTYYVMIEKDTNDGCSHALAFETSQFQEITSMLYLLTNLFQTFPIFFFSHPDVFRAFIDISKLYLNYPYDETIRNNGIILFNTFLEEFKFNSELHLVCNINQEFFEIISKGILMETDFENFLAYSTSLEYLTSYCCEFDDNETFLQNEKSKEVYFWKYIQLIPNIFQNFVTLLDDIIKEDKYYDGVDLEFSFQFFENLISIFKRGFKNDYMKAIQLFEHIITIVPYFNNDGLFDPIKIFLMGVWTIFYAFSPEQILEDFNLSQNNQLLKHLNVNQVINDLINQYKSQNPLVRKYSVKYAGKLCLLKQPQLIPVIIPELEKIIMNDDNEGVKNQAIFQFSRLSFTNNELLKQNALKIIQMNSYMEKSYEDHRIILKYCDFLLELFTFLNENNTQRSSQFFQMLNEALASIIESKILDEDEKNTILQTIKENHLGYLSNINT